MKILRLILGDQLNEKHSWFDGSDPDIIYVMMEVRQETDYVLHHLQKLLLVFTAMRRFADRLRAMGKQVLYLKINDPKNRGRFDLNLKEMVGRLEIGRFEYQLPDEYRLDRDLTQLCEGLGIPYAAFDTEHFLTGRGELKTLFSGKKRLLLETFYRHMRRRFGILVDDGRPEGGRWNYDRENRSRWKGEVAIPPPLSFENDLSELYGELAASGVQYFGSVDPGNFLWPVDREQALRLLEEFVTRRLKHFGTYQDAMSLSSWSLFHSRLSPSLNLKLISPAEVVQRVLREWEVRGGEISLSQVEGFIRQIIGWREYMRGVYWDHMPEYEEMNYFDHHRRLPGFYWTGRTNMRCVGEVVTQSLEKAYAHHIQRLMVTGNFALLSGIDVDEIDRWYLGIYIDAIQWVEITNTRGMSQYADGGITATKPYAASARYIHRMSDYCERCHYRWNRRTGELACPFNSLYWNFFLKNRRLLRGNPRLGMVYRTLDRMDGMEKRRIEEQAMQYLNTMGSL